MPGFVTTKLHNNADTITWLDDVAHCNTEPKKSVSVRAECFFSMISKFHFLTLCHIL